MGKYSVPDARLRGLNYFGGPYGVRSTTLVDFIGKSVRSSHLR